MSHISKNTIHFSWDDVYLTYNLKKKFSAKLYWAFLMSLFFIACSQHVCMCTYNYSYY